MKIEVVVLLVFGAVVTGVAALVHKVRQDHDRAEFDRVVRARKLGWTYDGARDGQVEYRFNGGSKQIAWTMWYDSDRGDDSPTPKAYWLSENLRTARLTLVIIGQKRFALESGTFGRLLIGVVSGVATAFSGSDGAPDKTEFYESCLVLDQVRPAFHERFAVAQQHDMPRDWLDDAVQRALLDWPESERATRFRPEDAVEVNLGPRGLSITVQKMPDDMAHWQHLAALGEQLALRLAAARG